MSYELELVQTILHFTIMSVKHDSMVEYLNRCEVLSGFVEYLVFLFSYNMVNYTQHYSFDLLLLSLEVELDQLQVLLLIFV